MPSHEDEEIRRLHQDVKRRQYYGKTPQPIAESISTLLSRRGYAEQESMSERQAVWQAIVGSRLAAHCRVGHVRRGVLEILVRNSTVVQELTFQKKTLLKDVREKLADLKVRDLRFRVDLIDE